MSYHDCLVWVGRSYPTIADYIKEAETRGCCRQVPSWPSWITPGVSRVFLAHHGNSNDPGKGVVFGYYAIAGVDVIVPPGSGPLKTPAQINHSLRSWPVNPPPQVPNFPVPGGFAISTIQTELEEARDCPPDGLRLSPKKARGHRPALYLVDRLERAIAERFRDWLTLELRGLSGSAKSRKLEVLRSVAASKTRNRKRQAGHPEFIRIMAAEARRTRCRVPRGTPRATVHGALVVFHPPYPSFERRPVAAFRGLIRIDGRDLLEQIKRRKTSIDIPYYIGRDETDRQRQLAMLARSRHLTISAAQRESRPLQS